MIWDTILGYVWLPLSKLAELDSAKLSNSSKLVHPSSSKNSIAGTWFNIDAELALGPNGSDVKGTKLTTGHKLLLDVRFENCLDGKLMLK